MFCPSYHGRDANFDDVGNTLGIFIKIIKRELSYLKIMFIKVQYQLHDTTTRSSIGSRYRNKTYKPERALNELTQLSQLGQVERYEIQILSATSSVTN